MSWAPNSDLPNSPNPRPGGGQSPTSWQFHERYASDPEFKRQVDEGRRKNRAKKSFAALESVLKMVKDGRKVY